MVQEDMTMSKTMVTEAKPLSEGQYRALREVAINGGLWVSRMHSGRHAPGFIRKLTAQALRKAGLLEFTRTACDSDPIMRDCWGSDVRIFLTAAGARAIHT